MYTTNLSLMAMLGGAVVMAASQEGPTLVKAGDATIDASFEYSFDEEAGSLGSHMITLNAEFTDGTGPLVNAEFVEVALCFEWLDTSDVKLIKCLQWEFSIDGRGNESMDFYAISSTGASTLDVAAFSPDGNLGQQMQGFVDTGSFEETDDSYIVPKDDPVYLQEDYSNWSIVQANLVSGGNKLTGVTALELVDESELAVLRDGGSIPGVCTLGYSNASVVSNVNIVQDYEAPEEESAARLSSSLLTLAMLAIWTASI